MGPPGRFAGILVICPLIGLARTPEDAEAEAGAGRRWRGAGGNDGRMRREGDRETLRARGHRGTAAIWTSGRHLWSAVVDVDAA